ncbi:MAG: carbamoyltransferase HypF [Armatimonadetes bacterium]|nr:carbamoyltransferase HypF [Armatimonadota bacterium]
MPRKRLKIIVEGIVQGVGFRPFVSRLALDLSLGGSVHNFTGGVSIEVEGDAVNVEEFLERLVKEAPPISSIERIAVCELSPTGQNEFVIVQSQSEGQPIFVSPDVAICPDCARELADPSDRRYLHPFINCTNCGPRFTIIRQLPYDRPFTSMARFEMCGACRAEYEDITNRRYHAQPVCCHECGPTLWLADATGRELGRGRKAIALAREMIARGGILAVKGIGGFHLACDATDNRAVHELRRRKNRWAKPLAVMSPSLQAVRTFAEIDETSAALLQGPQAPIVLLPKLLPERLAEAVAPDSSDYGVMLPYTPLHMLLLGAVPLPDESSERAQHEPFTALVMTSGNLSDEPICTDNEEALERLRGIADAFLLHDREILTGCDDSVVRSSGKGPMLMRRSRGFVPLPVKLPVEAPPLLAVGGHFKNTFCIARGTLAYPSQHIGDLDNAEALDYFRRALQRMRDLFEIEPRLVACDLHPDYASTRMAEEIAAANRLSLVRVQHHHAHMAAVLADNGLHGPAVGIICDGTGYGPDGTIWGCELLVGDLKSFRRAGHLRYVPLPGGEMAVRQPWRVALAWLVDTFGSQPSDWPAPARRLLREVGQRGEAVLQMIERNVNCPLASSAGRLFDAVAALIGLRLEVQYEAQAAMALEAAAAKALEKPAQPLRFDIVRQICPGGGEVKVIDPRPAIRQALEMVEAGALPCSIAMSFHIGFAICLVEAASIIASESGLKTVAVSGGTFQNRILLELVVDALAECGLEPVYHRGISPNDSGLCVGQAAVAAARWSADAAGKLAVPSEEEIHVVSGSASSDCGD